MRRDKGGDNEGGLEARKGMTDRRKHCGQRR